MTRPARITGLADLFGPEARADPYPVYARLRATMPVWQPMTGLLVLSRHHDCAAVLRDPRFGHAEGDELVERRRRRVGAWGGDGDLEPPPVRSFLGLNPPDHTRLRRLVSRSFTPRHVDALRPRIQALTDELLGCIGERETVDIVEALASPLPVGVISELLGVPPADRDTLVGWSHALAKGLDPAFLVTEAERGAQARARDEFAAYLLALVEERRRSPGRDLLSELVVAQEAARAQPDGRSDEALTMAELIATCILLLIAGHETTTSLIATGVLSLLRHPSQLRRLREDPDLFPGAVEELLRFDAPVQVTMRSALADATCGGVEVPAGTFVLLLLGAANRDPAAHTDPDRLDVGRTPRAHLAFGQGIHFCLGAPLARLEAQIALQTLLARYGEVSLAGDPEWKDTSVLHGVRRLDVSLGR